MTTGHRTLTTAVIAIALLETARVTSWWAESSAGAVSKLLAASVTVFTVGMMGGGIEGFESRRSEAVRLLAMGAVLTIAAEFSGAWTSPGDPVTPIGLEGGVGSAVTVGTIVLAGAVATWALLQIHAESVVGRDRRFPRLRSERRRSTRP